MQSRNDWGCGADSPVGASPWTAWEHTGGRTGRWRALVKAGIPIRARGLDEPLAEYRRPAPLERRRRQVPGAHRGIVEQFMYDPKMNNPSRSTRSSAAPAKPLPHETNVWRNASYDES
jgi:hypothetical protein